MDDHSKKNAVSAREDVLTLSQLREYFVSGFKPEPDWKVGVEWEKIGVYMADGTAIPYSGSRGVESILSALVGQYGWRPLFSSGRVIALKKND